MNRGSIPGILGLFEKRIVGDDVLLELARTRFREAGLGSEFYAEDPGELEHLLAFRPSRETPATVHLPRGLDLLDERGRRLALLFAHRFAGQLYGLTVHDQKAAGSRLEAYLGALEQIQSGLAAIPGGPLLFIEYASGLDPELYVRLFRKAREFDRISACIDSGHLGLWQVRKTYARLRPGENLHSIKASDGRLPECIDDIQTSVGSAPATVLGVIREIGGIGKPLHFHLHDGHPLWNGEFGVSDHLSFLTRIPIPFPYQGERTLPPMYGPAGLAALVKESLASAGGAGVTCSLEIHPTGDRLPLGEYAHLFSRWKVKDNAEKMNHWLATIVENQRLILAG